MNAPLAISFALLLLGYSLCAAGAPSLLVGLVACVGACWVASWLDEPAERYEGSEREGKG